MSASSPKFNDDHLELLRGRLRELVSERAQPWDEPADDDDIDDEWIDWIDTYEDAIDGLNRLGVDPYDDPLSWIEFLDPIGGFDPNGNGSGSDERRFLEYLGETYGVSR